MKIYCIFVSHSNTILVKSPLNINDILQRQNCASVENGQTIILFLLYYTLIVVILISIIIIILLRHWY